MFVLQQTILTLILSLLAGLGGASLAVRLGGDPDLWSLVAAVAGGVLGAWIVFGPLSRAVRRAPQGNPFGDAEADVRAALEAGRPGVARVLIIAAALTALVGIAGIAIIILMLLGVL